MLYPAVVAAWELFVGSLTQLRYVMVGVEGSFISLPAGFDYPGVRAHARSAGIKVTPDLWALFQTAESAYLKAIKEQQRR